MRIIILAILFLFSFTVFSQVPDTIIIKTEIIKGFGPFGQSLSFVKTMEKDNYWNKTIPNIKGVPLNNLLFSVEQTDFLQHSYQSHEAALLTDETFDNLKSGWNWNPLEAEYSKIPIKLDIAIAAFLDESGKVKILVDKNNNYDLSDETPFSLPDFIPGQNYWGRYNDLLPFKVEYETFVNGKIEKSFTWLYLDYDISMTKIKIDKTTELVLGRSFAEYHSGEFKIKNKTYIAAVKSDRAAFRDYYTLKVWEKGNETTQSEFGEGISKNGNIRIDDYYYTLNKITTDGKYITLIKNESVETLGGSDINMKAVNFISKSMDGQEINLSSLKGNYVLLDFWGTWCSPCVAEIPSLKKIYDTYKEKNFKIIGIAADNKEAVDKFVKEKNVEWSQILQSEEKSILSLYGVQHYPTTFLIDPNGIIIAKDIRTQELEIKLKELIK